MNKQHSNKTDGRPDMTEVVIVRNEGGAIT
jgi:hypothetical protein